MSLSGPEGLLSTNKQPAAQPVPGGGSLAESNQITIGLTESAIEDWGGCMF